MFAADGVSPGLGRSAGVILRKEPALMSLASEKADLPVIKPVILAASPWSIKPKASRNAPPAAICRNFFIFLLPPMNVPRLLYVGQTIGFQWSASCRYA